MPDAGSTWYLALGWCIHHVTRSACMILGGVMGSTCVLWAAIHIRTCMFVFVFVVTSFLLRPHACCHVVFRPVGDPGKHAHGYKHIFMHAHMLICFDVRMQVASASMAVALPVRSCAASASVVSTMGMAAGSRADFSSGEPIDVTAEARRFRAAMSV